MIAMPAITKPLYRPNLETSTPEVEAVSMIPATMGISSRPDSVAE